MPGLIAILLPHVKRLFLLSWQFFTGVVITIAVFASNFVDLKQPELTVQITAINTSSSEPIDIIKIRELSSFQDLNGSLRVVSRSQGLTPDDIDRQLLIATNQLSAQVNDADRHQRQLDSLISNPPKDQDAKLSDLERELEGPFGSFQPPASNGGQEGAQAHKDAVISQIRKQIDDQGKTNADSAAKLDLAQKQWTSYKETVLPNKAHLLVTCAIGNQGAGATSLKPQALLRANLGEGNYLDLPMRIKDYESSPPQSDLAVLQSRSYKVMRFQSEEVESMTEADRLRFKTFLGNVSPATIFVADVRGRTYPSNSVPFSPGVYEQKVYDSLKEFASKSGSR